jgi:hypothetical protein
MVTGPLHCGAVGKAKHHDGECVVEENCTPHGNKEGEVRKTLQGHAPSELIPPARPYFLVSTTFQKPLEL